MVNIIPQVEVFIEPSGGDYDGRIQRLQSGHGLIVKAGDKMLLRKIKGGVTTELRGADFIGKSRLQVRIVVCRIYVPLMILLK